MRAGRAGLSVGIGVAVAGAFTGAVMIYVAGKGASAQAANTGVAHLRAQKFAQSRAAVPFTASASRPERNGGTALKRFSITPHLREQAPLGWYARRDKRPSQARKRAAARLAPPASSIVGAAKPKIVIIFDDVGLDKKAFETIMGLPGPLTVSFIPYARDLQTMADRARARGDAVMLHLPMTPVGAADPGPMHLDPAMPDDALYTVLDWNLDRFEGYSGVNNHMGSAFTADYEAMEKVLSALKERDLFFLDSLTTADSEAARAGAATGVDIFARDVFLDPDGDRETIYAQLRLVEEIAAKTGFVVAICHPRAETLAVIGPWLTSAPARGFELATVDGMRTPSNPARTDAAAQTAF